MFVSERDLGPLDKALIRYWSDWMRHMKRYRKTLQRIASRDLDNKRIRRELLVLESKIGVLGACIAQVHVLQKRCADVAQTVEQPPCKRQVDGSNPVHWHQNA